MNSEATTVFVVDDDESVRSGLARLLRSGGWSVETFQSAREFLERISPGRTGCLVLDVRMPDMTGPELQDRMQELGMSLPIVFLTAHGDVPTSVRAMKRGAVDFLLKPVDAEMLLRTLAKAIDQHMADLQRRRECEHMRDCLARLSRRERQVMESVISGCRNKEIAAQLGISEKTVKVHRGRVMQKMEVGSLAELVHLCDTLNISSNPSRAAKIVTSDK